MLTFAPGPDDDFSDTLKLVSQLQRTVNNLIAQALPKPNPALRVQRAMGQMLAQQINQRTALSASLAVNRLAAIQRPAMASASARLPEIMDELPDVADSEIAIRDAWRELRRWARENPTEAQIIVTVTVCVVGIASNVLIVIYL